MSLDSAFEHSFQSRVRSSTEGELLLDTYTRYLQVINDFKKCGYSKDNCELNFKFLNNLQPGRNSDVNDAMKSKKKAVMITFDPLALVAEQTKVSKRKGKVVAFSESEGSDDELKKITTLLAKAFNRKKFYSKPTNNNLRTSSATSSANKKQEYVKSKDKKEKKKLDDKKREMSKVKCYNYKDEQVLLAEDHAWMESSSDSDQEINANMVFMAHMEKVLSDSKESSSSKEETIAEVCYYTSESESESEYETLDYYDNFTNYGLFVNNDDDQEIFHDSSEKYSETHIGLQMDHDPSAVDHNNYEETANLTNKLIKEFDKKIAKYHKRVEKANQQSKEFENQTKFLQEKCNVLQNQRNTFEVKNNELNKQIKVLIEKNDDLHAQTKSLQEQLKVKHVVIDNHVESNEFTQMYVWTVILEKIIIDLEDEVVSLLDKEKENLKIIESLKSKDLDTLSSVRRPKVGSVEWKKKGSSNTSKDNLSSDNHSNFNKNVKRYSCKDLMLCNNSHLRDTQSAHACNNDRNSYCNSYDVDVNDFFVFDDHMTGNRALLKNFVEIFLGTVRYGNYDFVMIVCYEDVVIGSMAIKRVYYVEGLGHNLFSVGQFCNKGLEVDFRKSTCFIRNENGVDLLTSDRSSNLYTIALNEIASNSSNCLLAKASSSRSWLWHQRLSHLNFATINNLVKNNLVRGLPKIKFKKYHLCFTSEQEKIHRKHHKSKTAFASNQPLYLLHIDLGGPMRVESINGKRFVLVVVDVFSRTPQQNGVVERRNRTLVVAVRTILTFANLPMFLWAEAIATACFTQNRSIIHKRFDKTPYELINKRKPNIKFFHVSGCRCYLLNDYDDVGKLKAIRDIGVFVGYSKDTAAFRVYNKRTRKIHERVNVNFDEISEMAFKQFSLEPGLTNLNKKGKSLNPTVSQVSEASKKDLEDSFQNFYDEYFDSSKLKKSLTTNVETSNNEGEVFYKVSESFQGEFSSSSLNDDVQQSLEEVILPQSYTQSISDDMIPNVDEASSSHNVFNE
nr:integrase, catalytic region, zinc finger, CCHC-type, peptidase aspartic, catalytic [Tanacetum cinerariifolium]